MGVENPWLGFATSSLVWATMRRVSSVLGSSESGMLVVNEIPSTTKPVLGSVWLLKRAGTVGMPLATKNSNFSCLIVKVY